MEESAGETPQLRRLPGPSAPRHAGVRGPSIRATRLLVAVALGFLLITQYWRGAQENLIRVNTNPDRVDQGAYISYAEKILREDRSHVGNRNRMPLYPFLLSSIVDAEASMESQFPRAKLFSLVLSLVLLAGIALLLADLFSPLEAVALLLITVFSLYIFKAAYVQAELLYYTVTAYLFVLMLRYLTHPSMRLAIVIGMVAGIAHLTKASLLPALGVFLVVALLWGGYRLYRETRRVHTFRISPEVLPVLVGPVLVTGFFLLMVFPYVKNSWYRFGSPFYNVNSTFYVWYDTWDEVERGTRAHGDRGRWPDMPADEIPSLRKYIREHTVPEMVNRVFIGLSRTFAKAAGSYGYAKYVLAFLLGLTIAAWLNREQLAQGVRKYPQVISFLAAFFLAHILLNAWYYDFVDGNRLVLALYVPFLITCGIGIRLLMGGRTQVILGRSVSHVSLFYALLLAVFAFDLPAVLADRILRMFGGE
jgi:hypothetical protein